ncbi:MAG: cyclic pyranopterin monophosphate synthase MoaC [Betaproteobacteria bacterium TMED41]|nr:MAG: cyclic pyranopterin monophosphate synthase MoaC [Betaproteobacteria bacterium TMED41]
MSNLTHFNSHGNVHMVDISQKRDTKRLAFASGQILMQEKTLNEIKKGTNKKGDVLGVARIAAIQAAKKTCDLIPLCHLIFISNMEVYFTIKKNPPSILCEVQAESTGKTGVEMEALTAVHIGLLTIYDMAKSIDRGMIISNIRLEKKAGGKSGKWERTNPKKNTKKLT